MTPDEIRAGVELVDAAGRPDCTPRQAAERQGVDLAEWCAA